MAEPSRTVAVAGVRMMIIGGLLMAMAGCATPALDRADVSVGGQTFRVEVARSDRQQNKGLSDRSSVPEGTGMLFDFAGRDVQKVWMADTVVPLDAAWVADDAVVAVRTLQPCDPGDRSACPTWSAPRPVDALLEVPAGALDGVRPGSPVRVRDLRG